MQLVLGNFCCGNLQNINRCQNICLIETKAYFESSAKIMFAFIDEDILREKKIREMERIAVEFWMMTDVRGPMHCRRCFKQRLLGSAL